MKNTILFACFVLLISGVLFAQQPVTIISTDVPSEIGLIYEKKIVNGEAIAVNVGEAGANKVWDFTGYTLPITEMWEVVDKSSSPFNTDFPEANLVYKVTADNKDTVTYNYVRLTETDVSELGQGLQLDGTTTMLVTSSKIDPKTNFPTNYSDAAWSSAPKYEINGVEYNYGGFVFTVDVIATDSSYYEIDGWGTIKTELGEIECLRIKQTNIRNIFIKQFNLTIPGITKYIIYNWVAPKYSFVATIKSKNNEESANFTEATQVTVMSNFRPVDVSDAAVDVKIKEFSLSQNYPNPFNPVTNISYNLSKPQFVKLKIYNSLGEEISTLVNKKQNTGKHIVQWNGADLSSGVYFYEINFDNKISRKKCLLLK
jgi:hypothetical protein